jgi:RNA polymerase subunit RPABC4/transcription elongation factor Spt4
MFDAFFFFIGGLQPKVKILDEQPRRCPRCGLHQARMQRVDHYISLFFIPVLRVKTGEPTIVCDRCSGPVTPEPVSGSKSCRFCNRSFPADYGYCPVCGRRL